MKPLASTALAGFFLATSCLGAVAAPATPEEAAQITQSLARYLGALAAGNQPALTVAPRGDSYAVTIDFGGLAGWMKSMGLDATVAPGKMPLTLARQPDGNWRVTQEGDFSLAYNSANQSGTFKVGGVKSSTLYNTTLQAVVSGTSDVAALSSNSKASPPKSASVESTRESHAIHSEVTGVAAGPGAVTATFSQTIHDTKQRVFISNPFGAEGTPPFHLEFALGEARGDGKIVAMRSPALLDLWAWLVAHPSKDAVRGGQSELKPLLRAALPVFDNLSASMDAKNVVVTALEGKNFGADEAKFEIGFSGAKADGAAREAFAAQGITIADGVLPTWAHGLSPREAALDLSASGYDLGRVANAAIDALDLEATTPIAPRDSAGMLSKLLPTGLARFKLATLRFANADYELSVNGEGTAGLGAKPVGALNIRLKGFDAVQKALAEGGKTDQNAAQASASLGLARALSKPGPDGSLVWEIAMSEDGKLSVNGNALGGGK